MNHPIDFRQAIETAKERFPRVAFARSGMLVDGIYYLDSYDSRPFGDDDRSLCQMWGVSQITGKIVDVRRLPGHYGKRVYAPNAEEIAQVEQEVIDTGLCRRDELGRVVTNSGDCYLTLADGWSLWKPLGDVSDYAIADLKRRAIRPCVIVDSFDVIHDDESVTHNYWYVKNMESSDELMRMHYPAIQGRDRNIPANEQTLEWIYCLIGNVVDERPYGPDKEIRHGTKHFRPGAKVYYLDFFYGIREGGSVRVIGLPRRSKRLIKIIMPTSYIGNWRVKKVYDKRIIREFLLHKDYYDGGLQGYDWHEELRIRAEVFKNYTVKAPFGERTQEAIAAGSRE
jgi:hypothetical protein